jgi:hypothetical protein
MQTPGQWQIQIEKQVLMWSRYMAGVQAALGPGQGRPGGCAAGRGREPGERALLHHAHQVPA